MIRYRLSVLTDEAGQPLTISVAWFKDGEKQWERVKCAAPFTTLEEAIRQAFEGVDLQHTLW